MMKQKVSRLSALLMLGLAMLVAGCAGEGLVSQAARSSLGSFITQVVSSAVNETIVNPD